VRLATLRTAGGGTTAVRVDGAGNRRAVPLPYPDVGALLADPAGMTAAPSGEPVDLDEASLAPVVPWPEKIICLGLNYLSHISEMGGEPPRHPTLFAKFARALTGPRDPIMLARGAEQVDWEAELAVIVGSTIRYVEPDEALDAIAGYTVLNDVSVRDWQTRTPQWLQGKIFEASTPVGPWLVTPDEVDHARDLRITCVVDGEVMQDARTSDLVFRPEEVLAYISQIVTLVPGDLISMGTAGGVGMARTPQVFLTHGQLVATEIEGIGALENRCARVPS
jgi:acylpyruvate hydrolase